MKMTNGLLLLSLVLIWSSWAMADSKASVNIVYTNMHGDQGSNSIDTLASVLGSKEAAKKALIYNYDSLGGFSAMLTPQQVDKIKKVPGVVNVVRSKTATLHSEGNFNRRV